MTLLSDPGKLPSKDKWDLHWVVPLQRHVWPNPSRLDVVPIQCDPATCQGCAARKGRFNPSKAIGQLHAFEEAEKSAIHAAAYWANYWSDSEKRHIIPYADLIDDGDNVVTGAMRCEPSTCGGCALRRRLPAYARSTAQVPASAPVLVRSGASAVEALPASWRSLSEVLDWIDLWELKGGAWQVEPAGPCTTWPQWRLRWKLVHDEASGVPRQKWIVQRLLGFTNSAWEPVDILKPIRLRPVLKGKPMTWQAVEDVGGRRPAGARTEPEPEKHRFNLLEID